jgi:NDP-sugar pyrophosphorylase family protein
MLPVAILAGGLATRLRPVTERIPKSLVEVAGEPFIIHQLRLLQARGVRRVVLCVGFLGEAIERVVGDRCYGIEVAYSWDGPALRGTAGAIKNALPLLGREFMVVYGDSYLPCGYGAVESAFFRSGDEALMTVFRNNGLWDASNVEWNGRSIVAYDKRNRTPRMQHIDYGLGVFRATAFERVPVEGSYDLAELYAGLLAEGQLASYEVPERFYEVGSFSGLAELSRLLESQQAQANKARTGIGELA